jgi:hypothetical protein
MLQVGATEGGGGGGEEEEDDEEEEISNNIHIPGKFRGQCVLSLARYFMAFPPAFA